MRRTAEQSVRWVYLPKRVVAALRPHVWFVCTGDWLREGLSFMRSFGSRAALAAALVLPALVAGLVVGCAGGEAGPGAVLPGTGKVLEGRVVKATSGEGIAGAAVVATPMAAAAAAATYTRITGTDGAFRYSDLPAGNYTIAVDPPYGAGYVAIRSWAQTIPDTDETTTIVLPLIKAAEIATATLSVTPTEVTLTPGQTQRFTPRIAQAGASSAVKHFVLWRLSSPFGSLKLNPDGTCDYTAPQSVPVTQSVDLVASIGNPADASMRLSATAAIALQGATTPKLLVTPTSLSYGMADTAKSVNVANIGTGQLEWACAPSEPWIGIAPATGSGAGTVRVTVNRSGLVAGEHTGTLTFSSNGGSATVTVTMAVGLASTIAAVTVTPDRAAINAGSTVVLTAQAIDGRGNVVPVTDTWQWWSDNTRVATVTANGIVRGVGSGRATITARELQSGVLGTAQITVNGAPAIESLIAEPMVADHGGEVALTCTATDPDADVLTYTWTCDAGTIVDDGPVATWFAPSEDGYFVVSCTVSDGKGLTDSASVTIRVESGGSS